MLALSVIDIDTYCSPSLSEVLPPIAQMLHCQLVHDETSPPPLDHQPAPFVVRQWDESTYTGIKPRRQPTPGVIMSFMKKMFKRAKFMPENAVATLILVNRLLVCTSLPLTRNNWRVVVTICTMVTQKTNEDVPLVNADFSVLYPAITPTAVNACEVLLLSMLNYEIVISESVYSAYLRELLNLPEPVQPEPTRVAQKPSPHSSTSSTASERSSSSRSKSGPASVTSTSTGPHPAKAHQQGLMAAEPVSTFS